MSDWRSYDRIARRYDAVWGSRFETVARAIWDALGETSAAAVLDLGTGTGIVPRTGAARDGALRALVGCDLSLEMLSVARSGLPRLGVVAADAVALPLRSESFDVVTASFVLSHVSSRGAALSEVRRVLKRPGRFAMTSWGASDDEPGRVWGELLAEVVPKPRLEAASAEVVPGEAVLEDEGEVESVLLAAGFERVELRKIPIECRLTLEDYVADRELSSGARFARHELGPEGWAHFVTRARQELRAAVGPHVDYRRSALVAIAHAS